MTTSEPLLLEYKTAGSTLVGNRLETKGGDARSFYDLSGDPEGTAWCVVAVTGVVDDVNDVIVPGAFRRSLAERKMRGVKGHDWNRQVAVQRHAVELLPGDPRLPATLPDGLTPWPAEAGALVVKAAYILATGDGHDAWEEAKANGLDQAYSIGYKVAKARERGGVRYIHDLDVYEFSPVLHGANRYATLQAVKSHPSARELEDSRAWAELAETKVRGPRKVIDSAYWGRPVGTLITPGMKPIGPRYRSGGRDRANAQRGVTGGMGRAGIGGIRRNTDAGVQARLAGRPESDYSISRHVAAGALEISGRPESLQRHLDEHSDTELLGARQYLHGDNLPHATARDAIDATLRARHEAAGVEPDTDPRTRRATRVSMASSPGAEAARTNVNATLAGLETNRWGDYTGDGALIARNLEALKDPTRPLVASDDGRVAAMDRGRDDDGKQRGWAVLDTRTGAILAKGESAENVGDFVDGAADRLREEEDGRDGGSAGGAGAAALREVPAPGARGDSGGQAGGVLRGPGGADESADHGSGGRPGRGAGTGGDVPAGDGSTDRGPRNGRVAGDQGDAAGSGSGSDRGGADTGTGRAGQRGSGADGAGDRRAADGSGGVLGREGGDGRPGDGGDAVADPADDAGLAAVDVTPEDIVQPDLAQSSRIDDIPDSGERFGPTGQADLAPAGARAKLDANMAALRLLRTLQRQQPPRAATPEEQAVLARWAGWGALPKVFDDGFAGYAPEREELRGLLSESEWNEGRKNTLNAHYTSAATTQAIWDAVGDLGFDGGRVLEPGSGSGNFIGFAPDGANMVGVELDSTTAGISKYLYPNASIRNESFADTRIPDGAFDLTVGNVPYGNYQLYDPVHNADNESIHNHFINKSLSLTRPGGIVAVLTSRFTLDNSNDSARRQMYDKADLVGAVRLPTGSHRAAAGTDVIEDLLIFRVREPGAERGDGAWVHSTDHNASAGRGLSAGDTVALNDYWAANPDHVLGQTQFVKGRYGPDLMVRGGDDPDTALRGALSRITARAQTEGRIQTPRDAGDPLPVLVAPDSSRHEGHIQQEADGSFTQAQGGASSAITIAKTQAAEVGSLLGIRDALRNLLRLESATSEDTPEIAAARARLNELYDGHVKRYGPINRYGFTRSGARQNPPASLTFRRDPSSALVRALETYDPTGGEDGKGSATKASVFTKRASGARQLATTADNPADAINLSMDSYGEVRLDAVARMLGVDEGEARARLGTLVHEIPPLSHEQEEAALRADRLARDNPDAPIDPLDARALSDLAADLGTSRGELEPAAAYLSGNVRRKLAAARAAAAIDPRFQSNVEALEKVQPVDLQPAEIDARLGAAWIPDTYIERFAAELMSVDAARDPNASAYRPNAKVNNVGAVWSVETPSKGNLATETWGTPARPFPKLLQAVLEQRAIKVTYKDPGSGKTITDMDATVAAQAKADEIQERFSEWVWEDADRARMLAARYNDQFNAIQLRSYDGSSRTFPGMAASFTPRPHQVAAVERIVNEPTALLAHVVGAGKTAEMVMGTAELKRLGLARKPAIVVPGHMLEQFTREYLEVYPSARILAAGSDDLAGDKRREFAARAGVGDWDAIILTQEAFESIPMSRDQQQSYVDRELGEMRAALESAKADGRNDRSVKEMEKQLQSAETALKKLLDKSKDTKDSSGGITFEETGIDYLMVDEAHHYSNLRTLSKVQNAGATGSGKATDLHMKMEYLREHNESGRVATFATGTPIRNSMTQAYIMQRYLRPDLLHEAGVISFDQWAATFGTVVEEMELKPEGTGFRQTQRFAKFRNVPELLRLMHVAADVKLAEDLNLPTPKVRGGRTETVTVKGSPSLRAYIAELGERADKVRSGGVEPEDDNMLKISGDGRKAALSMALVGEEHEPGKIEAAADRITEIHAANKDRIYPVNPKDPTAGDDPNPGALQIVFLDLGTPKTAADKAKLEKEGGVYYDAYDKLRQELAARGMDPARVRFIHEAKNDAEKAEMFAAARNGGIDVLVGSSEKMGVGTNVQKRAVALHHLDAPWRPSDVEQRDGRIERQGNLNAEVQVVRYVTEGSFDAYMWQTLERKAKFINQIMRGSLDVREIEDIGDTAMSYAEVKALATGNLDMLAKAKVDTLKLKLERLERTHRRTQGNLQSDIELYGARAAKAQADAAALDAAIAKRVDTRGDAFSATIIGADGKPETFPKRAGAARATRDAMVAAYDRVRGAWRPEPVVIGTLGGHNLVATGVQSRDRGFVMSVSLDGVPGEILSLTRPEIDKDTSGANIVARAENVLAGMDGRRAALLDRVESDQTEVERMRARLGQQFGQGRELDAAIAKSERLTTKIQTDDKRTKLLGENWRRFIGPDPAELEVPPDDPTTRKPMVIPEGLGWNPEVDTSINDDPILGTDDDANGPPDTAATVSAIEAAEPERAAANATTAAPPADVVPEATTAQDAPDAGDGADGVDAGVLDAARADADAALTDGDAGALATALGRLGVPEDDNPHGLAQMMIALPDDRQRDMLDQIESVNARPDQTGRVADQQAARRLDRPADATPEPAPDSAEHTIPQMGTRGDVIRYITGADGGNAVTVPMLKFLRSNNGPEGYKLLDDDRKRMALTATAGRGRNSNEYNAEAARAALVRLADGDPSLPANAVGRRVVLTEPDPADESLRFAGDGTPIPGDTRKVTGRVVSVEPYAGNQVNVIIERDNPEGEGTPRASERVAADASLVLADAEPDQPAALSPDDLADAGNLDDGPAPEVNEPDPDIPAVTTAAPVAAGDSSSPGPVTTQAQADGDLTPAGPPNPATLDSALRSGTMRQLGVGDGDRIALRTLLGNNVTGRVEVDGRMARLRLDNGEAIGIGGPNTQIRATKLGPGDVPIAPPALDTGDVTGPAPTGFRARTNRLNAVVDRAGGGGVGGVNQLDGATVHTFSSADDDGAARQVADAVRGMWPGVAVEDTGRRYNTDGAQRRVHRIYVPDTDESGQPVRDFSHLDNTGGAPDVPEPVTPTAPDPTDLSDLGAPDDTPDVTGDAPDVTPDVTPDAAPEAPADGTDDGIPEVGPGPDGRYPIVDGQPRPRDLIHAMSTTRTPRNRDELNALRRHPNPQPGDRVIVQGHGRMRPGIVTKTGPKRSHVAFTTPGAVDEAQKYASQVRAQVAGFDDRDSFTAAKVAESMRRFQDDWDENADRYHGPNAWERYRDAEKTRWDARMRNVYGARAQTEHPFDEPFARDIFDRVAPQYAPERYDDARTSAEGTATRAAQGQWATAEHNREHGIPPFGITHGPKSNDQVYLPADAPDPVTDDGSAPDTGVGATADLTADDLAAAEDIAAPEAPAPADVTPDEMLAAQGLADPADTPAAPIGSRGQPAMERVLGPAYYRTNSLVGSLNPQDSGTPVGARRIALGRQINLPDTTLAGEAPEIERLADQIDANAPAGGWDQWHENWSRQLREAATEIRRETGTEQQPTPDAPAPAQGDGLSGNQHAAAAYQAFHLDHDGPAALAAIDRAEAADPDQADRWARLRTEYGGGQAAGAPDVAPALDEGGSDDSANLPAATLSPDDLAAAGDLAEPDVITPDAPSPVDTSAVPEPDTAAAPAAVEPSNILGQRRINNRRDLTAELSEIQVRRATSLPDEQRQAIGAIRAQLNQARYDADGTPSEPFVPVTMDHHAVADQIRAFAAELDNRPEGETMLMTPGGARVVDDLRAMADKLDVGAGRDARIAHDGARTEVNASYFDPERRDRLVNALDAAGSADPAADADHIYDGDGGTASSRRDAVLDRLNPETGGGTDPVSPHTPVEDVTPDDAPDVTPEPDTAPTPGVHDGPGPQLADVGDEAAMGQWARGASDEDLATQSDALDRMPVDGADQVQGQRSYQRQVDSERGHRQRQADAAAADAPEPAAPEPAAPAEDVTPEPPDTAGLPQEDLFGGGPDDGAAAPPEPAQPAVDPARVEEARGKLVGRSGPKGTVQDAQGYSDDELHALADSLTEGSTGERRAGAALRRHVTARQGAAGRRDAATQGEDITPSTDAPVDRTPMGTDGLTPPAPDAPAPDAGAAPDAPAEPDASLPRSGPTDVTEIQPGDQIDTGDGQPVTVLAVDPPNDQGRVYVTTDDGDNLEYREGEKVDVVGRSEHADADGPADAIDPTAAPDGGIGDTAPGGAPASQPVPAATVPGSAAPTPGTAVVDQDTVDEIEGIEADALGLVEADDGELEVTPEVAQRQDRVEKLLTAQSSGALDIGKLGDSELGDGRRDLVDELRLQQSIARRDKAKDQGSGNAPAVPTPADAAAAATDAGADTASPGDIAGPTPTPEAKPKRRAGLAGAVEDLAEAVEGGDADTIAAARRRALSSLTRSGGDTDTHSNLATELARPDAGDDMDPARLRELADALRSAARTRRNSTDRKRRAAKRIERDRLRSLIGSYDAELRNRGQDPNDHGGPVPPATPDETAGASLPGAGQADEGSGGSTGGTSEQSGGPDATAGPAGQASAAAPQVVVPAPFDRSNPDGPTGQARTTELVDGLVTQPWRLLGNRDTVFGKDATAADVERREAAARAAFGPVLDQFGPAVRRRNNETLDAAARQARAKARKLNGGDAADQATLTFAMLLPESQRRAFIDAVRSAAQTYLASVRGGGSRERRSEPSPAGELRNRSAVGNTGGMTATATRSLTARTQSVRNVLHAAGVTTRPGNSGRQGTVYTAAGTPTVFAPLPAEFETARAALISAGMNPTERPADGAVPRALLVAADDIR